MANSKDNPYFNSEGYPDPTAYEGMKAVVKAENKIEKKCCFLIDVLKFIIREAGFELTNRIELRHIESGKHFK